MKRRRPNNNRRFHERGNRQPDLRPAVLEAFTDLAIKLADIKTGQLPGAGERGSQ